MQKIYAVLNPVDGSYTKVSTIEECYTLIAQKAVELYLAYTHNEPFSIVNIMDGGNESWSAPDGSARLSTEQIQSMTELEINEWIQNNLVK